MGKDFCDIQYDVNTGIPTPLMPSLVYILNEYDMSILLIDEYHDQFIWEISP